MKKKIRKHTTGKPKGQFKRKNALELPVFETLGACAAATGIRLSAIKFAKKNGCLAFERQRVHLGPLLKWLHDPKRDDTGIDHSAEHKKWQAKNERLQYDIDSGDVISRAEVGTGVADVMASVFAELDRLFLTELPPTFKGRDEIGIRDLSLKAMTELKATLKTKFDEIGRKGDE